MYSDDEDQDLLPFVDLNASLYAQRHLPISLE